jgi:two-component system chemotaxis response regulator CheY
MTDDRNPETYLPHLSILLVEDDGFALQLARSALKKLGVPVVICARDGSEALQLLKEGGTKFDLIISDWTMPNMSGLDLLIEVRKTLPRMPFLMLTSQALPESVLDARKHGVNAYVVKPFSSTQLGRKIVSIFKVPVVK